MEVRKRAFSVGILIVSPDLLMLSFDVRREFALLRVEFLFTFMLTAFRGDCYGEPHSLLRCMHTGMQISGWSVSVSS